MFFCAHLDFSDFEEPAPSIVLQALPKDKQALLRHLEKTNSEALALAGDWEDACQRLVKTQAQIETYVSIHLGVMLRPMHFSIDHNKTI